MYTDQQIKDFIGQQGIADNPFALYNYAKQYGVAPGRIDQVMGYAPGTSDKWIQQQGLQGLAGSAVGGTRPTAGTYTDQQVRDFISQKGIGNNPHAIQAFANQYGVNPGQIESAMGYAPGAVASWQQSAGITGQAPVGSYAPPVSAPVGGAPTGAPAGAAPNPYMGAPTNPYMGGQRPQPMQQPQQQPQQPMQRPGLDNPYTSWMADDITRRASTQFMQQINPAINRAAVANGGYGGSRQGIAQGLAMSQGMDNIAGKLSGLYANQFNADRNYGLANDAMDLNVYNAYANQFNADRNYGLANDAMDLNVYNANMGWMNQGQQNQLNALDRLLGWNQQYGIGNSTNVQNTPLNYWQQFSQAAQGLGGMGGTGTNYLQGNPWLGALGGAMTAGNLWKSWGS